MMYPEFFWAYQVHLPEPGLEQKYWSVHRQTGRPTKVMALFSSFSMSNN